MSVLSVCPKCESREFNVRDSRPTRAGDDAIRNRVYRCAACGHRVSTKEYIVAEMGQPSNSVDSKVAAFLDAVDGAAIDLFGNAMKQRAASLGRGLGKTHGAKK